MNKPIPKPGDLVKLKRSGRLTVGEITFGGPGYSEAVISRYGIGLYLGPADAEWEKSRHKVYWFNLNKVYWFNLKGIYNMADNVCLEVVSE